MSFVEELAKQKEQEKQLLAEMKGDSPVVVKSALSPVESQSIIMDKPQIDKQSALMGMGQGAATGAMAGGPAGAAIGAGASLASTYLAQKAASERARRDRAAQIEQQYGQDQMAALRMAQQAVQGAFR